MRKLSTIILALMGCMASEEPALNTVHVQPVHPAVDGPISGVEVTLIAGGQEVRGTTDASGIAVLSTAHTGSATLQAQRSFTADETGTLFGHAVPHTLGTAPVPVDVTAGTSDVDLLLSGTPLGGLVIKELSFTGAPGVNDNHYFHDQFIELYNNSTEPISAAGLLIADVYGAAGEINPGLDPTPYTSDANHIYAENVWRIPANVDHTLQPGEGLIIAQDGTNHRPDSSVDLSGAHYESYVERNDMRDIDWPTVPNLERLHFSGGIDWLMTVFGPSVVIFRVEDAASLPQVEDPDGFSMLVQVPVSAIIDGMDTVMDASSGSYKRLPPSVDQGFIHASDTYTGESVRRRIARTIGTRHLLQDTNNTSSDFELQSTPTPGTLD